MIDIFVNGGKIDQVSASRGTVINVDEHSSSIVLSGSYWDVFGKGKGTHLKRWIIAVVCAIIMILVGWLIYEIMIVRRQATQLKQMESILQKQELGLLELAKQLKLQDAEKYVPDEMNMDSIIKNINN